MNSPYQEVVNVNLWGQKIGTLVSEPNGRVGFQYTKEHISSGRSISPIHLPCLPKPFFQESSRDVFRGLMGVFADSLPDLYGKKIIQKYFENKYNDRNYKPNVLHTLMYIGNRGLGALEYSPLEAFDVGSDILELNHMIEFAKKVVNGDLSNELDARHVITSIMQSGSLAGGARPKAVIGWNQNKNEIIAGVPPLPEGYEHWLIKFDGVGGEPQDWGKIEYTYSQIARLCGIEMSDTKLIRDETGRAHFMTKRFDILDNGERLHMHSLSGMLNNDFNQQRTLDYLDFLRTVRFVTSNQSEVEKAFLRMVFNYVGKNCDDHTKNFSFLMNKKWEWSLSPQYDLCYSYDNSFHSWVNAHQMLLDGNTQFSDEAILSLGKRMDIKNPEHVIENVRDSFSQFPNLAKENGISVEMINIISGNHVLST